MASSPPPPLPLSSVIDVWGWITTLAQLNKWSTNTKSLCFCSSSSSSSMNLSITESAQTPSPYITFSISADVRQFPISLWTSSPFHLDSKTKQSLDADDLGHIFLDVVNGILAYSPCKKPSSKLPAVKICHNFKDMFNLTFLSLAFLVCIY